MFSTHELDLLKILGNKKMSIADLTEKFYQEDTPLGAGNYVAAIIRRINSKCEYNNLTWTIDGEGTGRGGRTVWKTKEK